MKTFLAFIGAAHLICFSLATLGLADYHLCIDVAGECTKVMEKRYNEIPNTTRL